MKTDDFVVGLDIGTSKICALVGEKAGEDEINITGVGVTPSKGLRKGMVINLESTIESIGRAIEEAERKAGVEITKVYAGIAGGHIKGVDSRGVVVVSGGQVKKRDVDRAIDGAKAVALPVDREVIHVLPQEFVVDDHEEVKEPVGMSGRRLEVQVHIVTGAVASAQNIINCVNRAGFEVEDIILQPLASARAVLTEDEKDLGVILVDIGGGTTDIIVMNKGGVRHSQILALGGDHVTNDLAIGLRVPTSSADELKKTYGCGLRGVTPEQDVIHIKGVRNGISRNVLCEIIEMRIEETLTLVQQELEKTGLCPFLGGGVVLTGGTSLLAGIEQVAESVFDMPIRIGKPERGVSGLERVGISPIYATGVGLVQYGFEQTDGRKIRFTGRNLFAKVAGRMKEWLMEFS